MKTRQETFDFVARALAKQGRPSRGVRGFCMYRGPEGLKCAAGFLIPDADYSSRFENLDVTATPVAKVLEAHGYDLDLVKALQEAHDDAGPEDSKRRQGPWLALWGHLMGEVAQRFDLETTVLDAALREAGVA